MELKQLIEECSAITKSKGFDVSQHDSQLMLIATECAEAMEHVTYSSNDELNDYILRFVKLMQEFELYRENVTDFIDDTVVLDRHLEKHLEELADIQIRLCSYVGGNGYTEAFLDALQAKMKKNGERPRLHGKGF